MQTAAGQLGVAIENARLFTEEQRRARHLAFLNNISKMAISSEDAEQMMADIVREIQKNFRYDHIGIGIMDHVTKDIEIKAEAGTTSQALGRRIAVGMRRARAKWLAPEIARWCRTPAPGNLPACCRNRAPSFACQSATAKIC